MKLRTLMIALALAAGTAFAQAPYGTARAPADVSASPMASSTTASADAGTKATMKAHRKLANKSHAAHHASGKHHRHHAVASAKHHRHHDMASAKHRQMHAEAMRHHHGASAMGAGAARPSTSLEARTRQDRMDQAYADYRAKH